MEPGTGGPEPPYETRLIHLFRLVGIFRPSTRRQQRRTLVFTQTLSETDRDFWHWLADLVSGDDGAMNLVGSVVNLTHRGYYIHWGVIQISLANLLVVGLMILVFVLAIVIPFPKGRHE